MATSGSFGVNPSKAYPETPAFPEASVLTTGSNELGEWVFAQANGAIAQYAWCVIDEAGQAAELTTTNAESVVGVVQVALADNEYGWFWRGGNCGGGGVIKGKMATLYAANAAVNTTGTPGVADDASTTVIRNVVGTTTDGGGGSAIVLFSSGLLSTK